jgi:hypothetical protein
VAIGLVSARRALLSSPRGSAVALCVGKLLLRRVREDSRSWPRISIPPEWVQDVPMPLAFDPELSDEDRRQLAPILGVEEQALDEQLALVARAALTEDVELFLGRKVFTRGSDMREYRLYLLIRYLYGNRFPTEAQISALFQTTTSQSRSLLRAVSSKYQYELTDAREATLKAAVEQITVA